MNLFLLKPFFTKKSNVRNLLIIHMLTLTSNLLDDTAFIVRPCCSPRVLRPKKCMFRSRFFTSRRHYWCPLNFFNTVHKLTANKWWVIVYCFKVHLTSIFFTEFNRTRFKMDLVEKVFQFEQKLETQHALEHRFLI